MGYKYNPEMLQQIINESTSWSEVLDHFGLPFSGGSRTHLKKIAKEWGLDVSHFKAKPRGKPGHNKRPPEDILVQRERKGKPEAVERVRRAMIESGVLHACCECGTMPIWMSKPLVLQVDHIDGNRWNNTLSNVRFMCPNCHTQTDTWGNKKI